MDIKKYEVLLAVIDKGSFIKAASDLGYTQSGITYMMNSLEKECGFPLLQRSNKGVALTIEGERLIPEIRQLVQLNKRLEQDFSEVKGTIEGKVRIGCFSTILYAIVPHIMKIFHDKYPKITFDLVEENSAGILEQWLNSGFIDMAFISRQPQYDYEWITLKNDPFVIVCPKDSKLAQYETIPISELKKQSLFIYRGVDGVDVDIAKYFKRYHVDLFPTFTSCSDYAVLFMIKEKLGIGMVPELLTKLKEQNFSTLTTRYLDPMASREIGLAVKNYNESTLAVRNFVRLCHNKWLILTRNSV